MMWFPQTNGGSLVQFPFTRRRGWRVITNEMESGERITLPDPAAGFIEWKLRYADLSDAEMASLTRLYSDCGGAQRPFSFIDPTANLLAWSEELVRPVWESAGLIISAGVNDVLNTNRASSVSNSTGGALSLQQTIPVPGSMMCCLSVWARTAGSVTVQLGRAGSSRSYSVNSNWKRFEFAGRGSEDSVHSAFVLTVPAGKSISLFGFQVECQPFASKYREARAARGIYPETWFSGDDLKVTCDGPGRSSCDLTLISRIT